jgi:hypothetical protein
MLPLKSPYLCRKGWMSGRFRVLQPFIQNYPYPWPGTILLSTKTLLKSIRDIVKPSIDLLSNGVTQLLNELRVKIVNRILNKQKLIFVQITIGYF